ncbi:MAG: hypothetical protein H2060_05485 [Azoarcus sp.]|nr:hypothetical protein [Azoarcus sp.]
MSETPAFVFWGYGSEDVFPDFSRFVEQAGYDVLRLPDPDKKRELSQLVGRPFILLTSAHFTRDRAVLADFYPDVHVGCDLLEILDHCKPLLSVFYPHDLGTPLVVNEPALLSAFDLVLWPTAFFGYGRRPERFETVGWIGLKGHCKPLAERRFDAVLLFSDICWHRQNMGIEGAYRKLEPILSDGVPIKFPKWPGTAEFEACFAERGATVIPAETPAGELILDSRLILSNGLSSISVEAAYMGTPCINFLEDYLPAGAQHEFLAGVPGCSLSAYADFQCHMANPPAPPKPRVGPFEPDHVLKLILSEVDARRERKDRPQTPAAGDLAPKIELIEHSGPPAKSRIIRKTASPNRTLRRREGTDQTPPKRESAHSVQQASPTPVDPRTADQRITTQTALRLLESGDLAGAFTLLQGLANEGSQLWEPYFHIAQIAIRQNEIGIAEEFLTHACEREDPPATAHRELARMLIDAGRHEESLDVLSPVLRKGHGDPEALELLRKALGSCGALDPIRWARLLVDLRESTHSND